MKKLITAAAALAALLATSAAIADTVGVAITTAGFNPKDVTVEAGSAVSWKNSDTVRHDVVVANTTCRLALQPQQASACTFATPGTFAYDDPTTSNAAFAGKITVSPAPQRSVTISANRNLAIFGDAVTLSGTASGKKAGESVIVFARPAGEPVQRIDLKTDANGVWTLRVQPRARTEYQAQYFNVQSAKLIVNVRPRITFQKVGASRFLIVVLANRSLAGKNVDVTRSVRGRDWVSIGPVQLTSIPRTDTVAVKTVTLLVPRGTKLRVFMSDAETGPDYIDSHSNFIVK
ncbi:MAG: cupredoxin domain-containing protein [Gaiellaceae bacterium]